MTPAPGRR